MMTNWLTRSIALCGLLLGDLIITSCLHGQETAVKAAKIAISVTTDRVDALYKVGESASFSIQATRDGEPLESGEIVCVFSKDAWKPQPPQKIQVVNGKAAITESWMNLAFSCCVRLSKKRRCLRRRDFPPGN